jgi:hypothetical protein
VCPECAAFSVVFAAGVPLAGTLAALAIAKFYPMRDPQEFEVENPSGCGLDLEPAPNNDRRRK